MNPQGPLQVEGVGQRGPGEIEQEQMGRTKTPLNDTCWEKPGQGAPLWKRP